MRKLKLFTVWMLTIALLLPIIITSCGTSTNEDGEQSTEQTGEETKDRGKEQVMSEFEQTQGIPTELKEAPILADKVKTGDLPPIEKRLPKEPKIANDMPASQIKYEIGTYGGVLRTVTHEQGFDSTVFCILNEPLLNSPGLLGEEITGNVVKNYEASSDQKEFTFHMREGLKWSDGQPVTTEDVRFAVEDVLFNAKLTPVFPAWLRSGGKVDGTPMKLEILDDYTFKIIFDQPYGGFPLTLSIEGWRGYTDILKPKHFLQKYHVKYTPLEQLEPEIEKAGFQKSDWVSLFNKKDVLNWESVTPDAIGFPVLSPWMQIKATTSTVEYERNPYYFEIDEKGNQLPYIDKLNTTYVQDLQMVIMKTLGGEVDHSGELISLNDLPLLKENEANGGYKIYMPNMHRTGADIILNFNYDDPVWRKVIYDIRFRKALNLALDKDEIVDTVYYGMAKPAEIQGTECDIKEANKLLDEMGMKKGSDGLRLGPGGEKFSIPLDVQPWRPDTVPLTQLVVEQWRELGLDVSMKQIDASLWNTRVAANEIKATVIGTHGPVLGAGNPDWAQSYWAPLWNMWWVSNGQKGEEPPQDVKDFYQLIEDMRGAPVEQSIQYNEKIRADMRDNLWYFVVADNIKQPVAINAKIHNYTDNGFNIAQFFGAERLFYGK
ncbi:ABC transporter substrate-binding protein [Mahella australiensis]|uniref:Extracellular solute-binding protein family 5 n=1 Tax=Mahella australiensis (strain DSM 15567 / CIP 107919 / 50-1 BON) TaxID=697281 RepID=F3ZW26_MAHA5|nr:ABC transporter substrate-binding protein [Mahella australiensis]AEE96406.1 extracellular solute-binding protein family 5 [Mahella australiensis 50-1 BON]